MQRSPQHQTMDATHAKNAGTLLQANQNKLATRCRSACLQCRSQKIRCIRCDNGCLNCIRAGKDCSFAVLRAGSSGHMALDNPDNPDNPATCKSARTVSDGFTENSPQSPSTLLQDRFRQRTLHGRGATQDTRCRSAGKSNPEINWLPSNSKVSPRDARFLAERGCFDIPNQHALDQLFQHYFWHVHPLFPIIDEVSFWEMHRSSSTLDLVVEGKLSLLLLYGILYTSSSYVSTNLIESIGFSTIHQATSVFYTRGQLLYDSGFEESPISMAQGALMLSHCYFTQSPRSLLQEATKWLRIAIQHAKDSGAHKYHELPSPVPGENGNLRQTLKRLWWCCILRDRVMALAGRKDIQITRSTFDFDGHSPLGLNDLAEEIQYSSIYDTSVKRSLVDILTKLGELCIILTDVLSVSVFLGDDAGYTLPQQAEHANRIRTCRSSLKRWYDSVLRLQLDTQQMYPFGLRDLSDASIVVFTNVLLMYYHSTNLALCHQEMFILGVDSSFTSNDYNSINVNSDAHQIQLANTELVQCLTKVVQLRLAHWLPLGAAACAIIPLALQIVDLKLMSATSDNRSCSGPEVEILKDRQESFARLIEAMEKCRPRFLAVDWLLNCVRISAESFHQLLCSQVLPWSPKDQLLSSQGWTQIFQRQPKYYLSLATLMDFSVRVGELPGATDLSTRWRMIGRPKFIPASALHSSDISESLSLGDIEILTHIEDHYSNLWDTHQDLGTDSDSEHEDGTTSDLVRGHFNDTEEVSHPYDHMKWGEIVHQSALRGEPRRSKYVEHQLDLPRSWMEEVAIFAH